VSKFYDKAQEIKAAGVEQRGNFTPSGVPLRLYNWWLDNSPSDKATAIKSGARKENFCHFWRVVLFWTPLLWSFIKAASAVTSLPGIITLGVIAFLAFTVVVTTTGSWISFFQMLGVVLGLLAALVGIVIGGEWLNKKCDWFGPTIIIGAIVGGIGFVLFVGFMEVGFILFAYVLAGLAAGAVAIFAGWKVADIVAGRRAIRAAKESEEWDAFVAGEGPNPYDVPTHTPNKFEKMIAAFFSGVGDFLILLTQVVRVKKWGICPLVEVGKTEVDNLS